MGSESLSGSLAAGSICEFWLCQEWPRCPHVLEIRVGLNPPTSSTCTYTHTTYVHTTPAAQTHPFNICRLCRFWFGGVSSDKKAVVLALLKESQCYYRPETPKGSFSDSFRCGWQYLPYSFVPSFASQKTLALLRCGHHSLTWSEVGGRIIMTLIILLCSCFLSHSY